MNTALTVIIVTMVTAIIVPIHGRWILDIDLQSYNNPNHARYFFSSQIYCCCDCPSVTCCDEDLSNLNFCTDRDCNNKFLICLFDGESDDCVYSSTIENEDSITFGDGLTTGGITNPIEFIGEGQGTLTVTIYVFDDLSIISGTSEYRQNFIDGFQVEIEFGVTNGIRTPETYNGDHGVISVRFGYGIRCAEGFSGNNCSMSSPVDCSACNVTDMGGGAGLSSVSSFLSVGISFIAVITALSYAELL